MTADPAAPTPNDVSAEAPAVRVPSPNSDATAPGAGSGGPGAGAFAEPPAPPRDDFVDRLGDRLSQQHDLPEGRAGATSDVHSLPPTDTPSEEDDALDFPPPPSAGNTVDPFADFEDELEAENTRIDDSHLLAEQSTVMLEDAPAQPFLAVEKGNDLGREFVLQRGLNGIGRGIDNDVILADVAVSRRHLQVFLEEGDVLRLKDLGSGNGTQVNGRKVGTVVLNEGDRIEVGETILVVRTPGGAIAAEDPYRSVGEHTDESLIGGALPAPLPAPADPLIAAGHGYQPERTPSATDVGRIDPAPRSSVTIPKPVLIGAVVVGALLLALFGAVVTLLVVTSGDEEVSAESVATDESPFARGVSAYSAGRLDEAEELMIEAEEAGNEEAPAYRARIRTAREHGVELRAAQAALDIRQWDDVLAHTGNIPEESPFAGLAEPLRIEAITQIVTGHIQAGIASVEAGDAVAAQRSLDEALVINPEADVGRLREAIASLTPGEAEPLEEEQLDDEAPEEADDAEDEGDDESESASAPRPTGRRGGRTPRRVPRATSNAMPGIIGQYLSGQFSAAARSATEASRSVRGSERERFVRIARDITTFGRLWSQITRGRFASGVRGQMSSAMAIDQRISRNSQYRDRIRGHYITATLEHARAQSNVSSRCATVRSIASMGRGNSRIREMISSCETAARGVLAEAGRQRGPQAASTYARAMSMVPPSSAIYRQARAGRDAARRGTVMDEDGN